MRKFGYVFKKTVLIQMLRTLSKPSPDSAFK